MTSEELKELREVVQFIQGLQYLTDKGSGIHVSMCDKQASVGSVLEPIPPIEEEKSKQKWKVLSKTQNSDCVGGVCPIR